jgi:formylmethanofuran dehydrogenase subunit A
MPRYTVPQQTSQRRSSGHTTAERQINQANNIQQYNKALESWNSAERNQLRNEENERVRLISSFIEEQKTNGVEPYGGKSWEDVSVDMQFVARELAKTNNVVVLQPTTQQIFERLAEYFSQPVQTDESTFQGIRSPKSSFRKRSRRSRRRASRRSRRRRR